MRAVVPVLIALLGVGACGRSAGRFELVNDSRTWLSTTVWTRAPEDAERYVHLATRVIGPAARLTLEGSSLAGPAPIRLQVEALGPDVRTPATIWYELEPPGPARVRAWGSGSELWFSREDREQGLRPLSPLAARLIPPATGALPEPGEWLPVLGPEVPRGSDGSAGGEPLPKSEQGR